MPLRLRKFIGAILLITLVVSWALVAMALAVIVFGVLRRPAGEVAEIGQP